MTGHDALEIAGAAALGGALGAAYFVGLWKTVEALPELRHPGLAALASFVLRFALAAAVFVGLARRGGWRLTAAGLAGFLLARALVVIRLRAPGDASMKGPSR